MPADDLSPKSSPSPGRAANNSGRKEAGRVGRRVVAGSGGPRSDAKGGGRLHPSALLSLLLAPLPGRRRGWCQMESLMPRCLGDHGSGALKAAASAWAPPPPRSPPGAGPDSLCLPRRASLPPGSPWLPSFPSAPLSPARPHPTCPCPGLDVLLREGDRAPPD